jgi:nucleotide-binding universal stress UspA family protein
METQHLPTGCVVVGVDAAQPTDRALDWAADQAALEHRHLLLVHGCGSPLAVGTPWGSVGGPDPLELFSDMQAAGRALLGRATTRVVSRHPELVVHQSVRPTDPRQALLEVSADAAMIVVGSRGRGHVLSVVLGSVSEEVAGRASCPVVVIRSQHGVDARRGVLVGTDGTDESLPVLRFAYHQARLRSLPLTVMQTVWDVVAATTPAHAVPQDEPGVEATRVALAESVSEVAHQYPEVSATLEVGRGTAAECLLSVADTMDLVVVGHHERGILGRFTHGSVAVAVLEHASVAVAVVPVSVDTLARSV